MTELYPVLVVGLTVLLARPHRSLRPVRFALTALCLCFSLLLLSHLNFINTVQDRPQGDRATTEIRHQLAESNFHVTWQVFLQHYGPWAWSRPGP